MEINELLCHTVKTPHTNITKLVIEKGGDVNYVDATGRFPLWHALQNSQFEQLAALLAAGADEMSTFGGKTVLDCTCEYPVDMTKLKRILDIGFKTGSNFIRFAETNNVKAMELLLSYPTFRMDYRNAEGVPMLRIASNRGHIEFVALLLEKGADVNIQGTDGVTALMKAIKNNQEAAQTLLLNSEKIDLNVKDNKGNTALHYACDDNRYSVAHILLFRGADATIKNNAGELAFDLIGDQIIKKEMEKCHLIIAKPIKEPHQVIAEPTEKCHRGTESSQGLRAQIVSFKEHVNQKIGKPGKWCSFWVGSGWVSGFDVIHMFGKDLTCFYTDEKIHHHKICYDGRNVPVKFKLIIGENGDTRTESDLYL